MYIMYPNASNNTLSYTHTSSYVVWRVHPTGIYKENQCTRTNNMLEIGLMYLYWALQINVINASTIYTKYKSWIYYM